MFSNFIFQDIFGTVLAFCLFPLVIVFPGYILGWAFDLFEFRMRLLPSRFVISLLLSVAVSPILYYLLASLFSLNTAIYITALIALVFMILVFREKPPLPQDKQWRIFFWISLGWAALALFSLMDLQFWGRELYLSAVSFDNTTRVSIIDAMTRTGIPPVNPSFYPGHFVKLTFLYFFWYILASMVDLMGAAFVDARTALFASVIWCGIALMALIAFYLRLRTSRNAGRKWWRALIGVASLAITGLDIMPAGAMMYFGNGMMSDPEHWNEQITAWAGSLLWVPHHVASLIAGFVGVMLVHSVRGQSRTKQFTALVFSGIAFASALGLSMWVTLVFVLFWGVWMISLYFQNKDRILLFPMLIAGVVALLLSVPFLLGLLSGGSADQAGALPIALTIRSFRFADVLLGSASIFWQFLSRLVFLPLNYFLELGFFAIAGFVWLKLHKSDILGNPYYFAECLLLGVSFFIGSFTRSTLIMNNDLGWRAWLPGQFILLIWGVDVLERLVTSPSTGTFFSPRTKFNLVLLIALGVATTIFDVAILRSSYYFEFGREFGRSVYSARLAYDYLRNRVPAEVITQNNPLEFLDRPSGLYGNHQMVISTRTAFGVPVEIYNSFVNNIGMIFTEQAARWDSIDELCMKYSIDILIIKDTDPIWNSLKILKMQRPPLYENKYYALYSCGKYAVSH